MNKQEFIERMKSLKNLFGNKSEYVEIDAVIELASELDEPQKPVVPQFVANWIERERKSGGDLEDLFCDIVYEQDHIEWFREEENMNLVARAWLDGYEVEKEKRYLVKMKGISDRNDYLKYNKNMKHWYFGGLFIYANDVGTRTYHTRQELEEAGFGWVFDCPGIEIEEVE